MVLQDEPCVRSSFVKSAVRFVSRTRLVEVYFRWRPNLRDEGDNHVLELAVAAGDAPIVTFNGKDFRGGELRFPELVVLSPAAWLRSQSALKE
jgi:uncharacterized protein